MELACAFQALGCRTTIVEALPRLVPALDEEISRELCKSLMSQGVEVLLEHQARQVADGEAGVRVTVSGPDGERVLEAERLLVAVGRRPNPEGLDLQAGGIKTGRGGILVNEWLETSAPGVYAAGDCLGGPMLAHVASAQGEIAAENAMGGAAAYRPGCVPFGVYGLLEAAGAGMTEQELQEKKVPYHAGRFPLSANGRSRILNGGGGMVKALVGDGLEELLGVHILGPNATELAAEAALAIGMEATAQEIIQTIHPHPTVSEALREAVLAAGRRAIHIVNK